MSRAPDDNIEAYVGDGEWFKFGHQYGVKNETNWELDSWDSQDEWVSPGISLGHGARLQVRVLMFCRR